MKRPRLNPRKLLIASAGVATVNYAFAAGCGGKGYDAVANLMAPAAGGSSNVGGTGGTGRGTVANLVAPPPPFGIGGDPFSGVANLVAPPPPVVVSPPTLPPAEGAVDAAVPDAAAAGDAALDGG